MDGVSLRMYSPTLQTQNRVTSLCEIIADCSGQGTEHKYIFVYGITQSVSLGVGGQIAFWPLAHAL